MYKVLKIKAKKTLIKQIMIRSGWFVCPLSPTASCLDQKSKKISFKMDFSKSDWLLNLFHRNAQKRNNRLNDEWKRTRNLLWCLHILWNWTYWNNWIRTLCACACACACACVLSCAEHCAVSILRCLLIHVLCAEYDFVLVKHFILCSFHFVWLPAWLAGCWCMCVRLNV